MKRLFLIITIVFTLSTTAGAFLLPAFLYFGLPAAAVDLSIVAHVAAGSLIWWYNRPSGAKSVNSTGDLYSDGQVQWVDLKDSKLATYGASTKNKLNKNDWVNGVKNNPSRYPNLKSAVDDASKNYNTATEDTGWDVGKVYFDGNSYYQWTSKSDLQVYTSGSASSATGTVLFNSVLQKYYVTHTFGGTNGYTRQTFYGSRLGTIPPAALTEPDVNKLTGKLDTNRDNIVESVFRGEIDDFITSNPNVVHFEDGSGNDAKSQIPSTAMSQSQIDAALAGEAATDAAQNAYKLYSTTKNPADYQKYLDARAAELAANSTAKPEESQDDVNKAVTGNPARYDGVIEQPQKSSIKDLVNGFIASSPFHSIISGTNFSLSGATSSITLTVRGKNYSIDFSRWQTQLELLGSLILTSVHLSAVWIVLGRRD